MTKRNFYIFCTVILVLLLAFIIFALSTGSYWGDLYGSQGQNSFLMGVYAALLFAGAIAGGIYLGKAWWKLVYIDKKRWHHRLKKK